MNDITSISKKLWKLIARLFLLLLQLSKQVVLPNRKRKGNILNTLFLFYIGAIESIQHFEHRQFKMANLFQNKLIRKGMMLFSFLLFLLTSYEQPIAHRSSFNESTKAECSYQNTTNKSYCVCRIKDLPVEINFSVEDNLHYWYGKYSAPVSISSKRYLQNRRLLI